MRPLTASELLAVWELGFEQNNIEKGLSLLIAANPNLDLDTISKWSIEERDIKLLYLRSWMFGNQFINNANCPNCQEKVEWEMDIQHFSLPTLPLNLRREFHFQAEDYIVQFRLPNSEDLMSLNPAKILNNCLLEIKKEDTPILPENLPVSTLAALSTKMEEVSPLSNISINLSCPSCNSQWDMPFDILSYLWVEINNWAKNLLQEVYLLANAFKWSEKEILNMSSRRRQLYLSMLQS